MVSSIKKLAIPNARMEQRAECKDQNAKRRAEGSRRVSKYLFRSGSVDRPYNLTKIDVL